MLETAALRRAIALAGDEWEVGIVAAFARLQRAAARSAQTGDTTELDATHKQFHTALLAGCQSVRLLDLHLVLYDQASRYRQVMLEQTLDLKEFLASHEVLSNLVLSRQPNRPARYSQTTSTSP